MGTTSEKVTWDDLLEIINAVDDILKNDESKNQNEDTGVETKSLEAEFTSAERDAFDREFNGKRILRAFADAVAAVMTISSMTGMNLDKTLDLFVEKMRNEIHSEDTKVIMKIGDDIIKLFNLLNGNCSTLYETIAKNVFNDVGIKFCTSNG